eukprot:TRINITY_DN10511_c0_g2_i2.p2 TRINITY_DN10511_c0_g2~~TRINITY_DN10511_c0_g2_i2.p2  ORF type:complete len:281 (-),score=68.94 TRINITY_DN10511_c0_g2_i2:577-1419(-)
MPAEASNEPAIKTARVNLPEKPPDSWIEAFKTAVDQSLENNLAPLNARIGGVEKGQADLQKQMGNVLGRLSSLENRSSQETASTADSEWKPERIELKGWCTWAARETSGKTRAEILLLHNELTECLDQDLKSQVGKPMVYNKMNSSYHVRITGDGLHSVVAAWRDKIAAGVTTEAFELCDFFVRAELSPIRKKTNQTMARLVAFIEHHGGSKWKFTSKWHPEYFIAGKLADGSMQNEIMCAEVNITEGCRVIFHEGVKKIIGIGSIEDILVAFRLFKAQR